MYAKRPHELSLDVLVIQGLLVAGVGGYDEDHCLGGDPPCDAAPLVTRNTGSFALAPGQDIQDEDMWSVNCESGSWISKAIVK